MDTVLIVGNGAREHALHKALLRSDRPLCIFAYPGNPGIENDGGILVDADIDEWSDLADWAESNEVDLTVVGPEVPLDEGIVDIFTDRGLTIFGPSKKAAQIEGSKYFAKELMKKYSIPTAAFRVVDSKGAATEYLDEKGVPIVVKVSGLAAGKGAIVCDTREEAEEALDDIFERRKFGAAGDRVILEEKMSGEEASVFVLTDGKEYRILPVSQDHKPIGEGDTGPNTGGMGAYAPAPCVDSTVLENIEKDIIVPTLDAMKKEGARYCGLLYCGLMLTDAGPKVVEFNCRFGDPETQAVLPLVACDWYDVLSACARGSLRQVKWEIKEGACAAVVCASKGYPGAYEKGKVITGIEKADHMSANIDVYHAGTRRMDNGNIVTGGGRVLTVSAWAETLQSAIALAYEGVAVIEFEGKTFRGDIGEKGVKRIAG
jgi:phosphoribosylamine--glycine ligase